MFHLVISFQHHSFMDSFIHCMMLKTLHQQQLVQLFLLVFFNRIHMHYIRVRRLIYVVKQLAMTNTHWIRLVAMIESFHGTKQYDIIH